MTLPKTSRRRKVIKKCCFVGSCEIVKVKVLGIFECFI